MSRSVGFCFVLFLSRFQPGQGSSGGIEDDTIPDTIEVACLGKLQQEKRFCTAGEFYCYDGFGCSPVDECLPCPSGSYMTTINACAKCLPCSKTCNNRQIEIQSCNRISDRICVCKEGFSPHHNRSNICMRDVNGTSSTNLPLIVDTRKRKDTSVISDDSSSPYPSGYLHLPLWLICVMIIVIICLVCVVVAVAFICLRGHIRRQPAKSANIRYSKTSQEVTASHRPIGSRSDCSGQSNGEPRFDIHRSSRNSEANAYSERPRTACQHTDNLSENTTLRAQSVSTALSAPWCSMEPPTLDLKEDDG